MQEMHFQRPKFSSVSQRLQLAHLNSCHLLRFLLKTLQCTITLSPNIIYKPEEESQRAFYLGVLTAPKL